MLKKLSLLYIILILALSLSACGSSASDAVPRAGSPAPNFQVWTTGGQQVKLSDFAGRPVLINFWATWCGPCKDEMPQLEEVYRQHKDSGLVVLGVATREDPAAVKTYIQEGGYDWLFLLDNDAGIKDIYHVAAYPSSVFIDRKGIIRVIMPGSLDRAGFEAQLPKIL